MKVRSPTRALFAWLSCCAISIVPWAFGSTNANAADPIKIGAVLPFSGGVELYGAQAKLGVDLAAADINAAGGILGRPVEIVYRDPVSAYTFQNTLTLQGAATTTRLRIPIVDRTKVAYQYRITTIDSGNQRAQGAYVTSEDPLLIVGDSP